MKYIIALGTAVIVVAIASYFVLSLSMRMIADDFCMTANIQNYGAVGLLERYYQGWSGQFAYPFVKAVVFYTLGLNAHPIMPIAIYLMWWLGNFVLLWLVFRKWNWKEPFWISLILSSLHIFILLSTMASRQTMYWLDALLFHVLPLSLLVWIVVAWWIAIQSPKWKLLKMLFFAVVMFVYGGMHILPSLFAFSFWFLTVVIVWRFSSASDRPNYLPISLAAFAGISIAFAIVLLAPGNVSRLEAYENSGLNTGVFEAMVIASVAAFKDWFDAFSLVHIFVTLSSVMAVYGYWHSKGYIPEKNAILDSFRQHTWLLIGLALLAGLLYTAASLFLPALSSGRTPTRVFVTAGLARTWVTLFIGFLLGLRYVQIPYFKQSRQAFIVVAMLLLIGLGTYRILGNVQLIPEYSQWAEQWDNRHEALLDAAQNGATVVEVAPFTVRLPKFLGPETDASLINFARGCMERYYGIEQIESNSSLDIESNVLVIEE